MNKASLIDTIVEKTGMNRNAVETTIDTMLDVIVKELQQGSSVNLTGFGKFSARVRSARMGVDPQNPSERIQIPEVVVPKFKAGKALKDSLKHSQGAKQQTDFPDTEDEAPDESSPEEPTEY